MMKNVHIISAILVLCSLAACSVFKPAGLYETEAADNVANIRGYTATQVFTDQMSSEIWFTNAPSCVKVNSQSKAHTGSGSIQIEWNKQAGNCPWLGMGVGWENWSGKNFESIVDTAALSFYAKTFEGQYKGLPWAVGFEDFEGGQAWTGVTAGCVKGGVIDTNWTQVIIPLSLFPFEGREVNITAIKQVIFQFESSGKVLIDDISIIPYLQQGANSAAIKGDVPAVIPLGNSKISISTSEDSLFITAALADESPLMNVHEAQDIWNGDAIELAFSSIPNNGSAHKIYYPTDRHIGIRCNNNPVVWDWSRSKYVNAKASIIKGNGDINLMMVSIAWKDLGIEPWKEGFTYGFEVALDEGNNSGRVLQTRWNSAIQEGFNFNPSLWGKLIIE